MPAEISRDLTEIELVREYHWLPQEIARIPYKWLQKYYVIMNIRNKAQATVKAKQSFYNDHGHSSSHGKSKRYIEV